MKIDLHIHSKYSSDSHSKPKDVIKAAKKRGLGGIAITDHNSMAGYRSIKDVGSFIVVPGVEISTDSGHVIALGIQEDIDTKKSVGETLDDIYEQGGLAIASHPYRFWSGLGEDIVRENSWSAIETLNGRSGILSNQRASKLAASMDTSVVGGSDSHSLATIGKAYTVMKTVSTWEDVIDAIQKGDTSAGGSSRTFGETCCYVTKALSGWAKRGFTRI